MIISADSHTEDMSLREDYPNTHSKVGSAMDSGRTAVVLMGSDVSLVMLNSVGRLGQRLKVYKLYVDLKLPSFQN